MPDDAGLVAHCNSSTRLASETAEASLVEAARCGCGPDRLRLARMYLAGAFGARDLVSTYVWTLAAWNHGQGHFQLAKAQQYLEFLLTTDEKVAALETVHTLLPHESDGFIVGRPFNLSWREWLDDDPIPARPPEQDFRVALVTWLRAAGWPKDAIKEALARCPPCNGLTRAQRCKITLDHLAQRPLP